MAETTITNDTRNAVIVSLTAEHNGNDIYNRMIGVSENRSRRVVDKHIEVGTRIYVHYIGEGIVKILEAVSTPYTDHTKIPEWDDGQVENYPIRVNTKVIWDITKPIKPRDVVDLGISHVDTDNPLIHLFPQHSVTPISAQDSNAIFDTVVPKSLTYWEIDGNKYRRVD